MFELAKDVVSKYSIVFKVLFEEVFKLSLCHWILGFEATFMLMPLLNYYYMEKQYSKKDLVVPVGRNGFKLVFILLAETIVI